MELIFNVKSLDFIVYFYVYLWVDFIVFIVIIMIYSHHTCGIRVPTKLGHCSKQKGFMENMLHAAQHQQFWTYSVCVIFVVFETCVAALSHNSHRLNIKWLLFVLVYAYIVDEIKVTEFDWQWIIHRNWNASWCIVAQNADSFNLQNAPIFRQQ